MARKTAQTQNATRRYAICTICYAEDLKWRIYAVDVTRHGQFYRGELLFSAHSQDEAERWARENCWNIFTCF